MHTRHVQDEPAFSVHDRLDTWPSFRADSHMFAIQCGLANETNPELLSISPIESNRMGASFCASSMNATNSTCSPLRPKLCRRRSEDVRINGAHDDVDTARSGRCYLHVAVTDHAFRLCVRRSTRRWLKHDHTCNTVFGHLLTGTRYAQRCRCKTHNWQKQSLESTNG